MEVAQYSRLDPVFRDGMMLAWTAEIVSLFLKTQPWPHEVQAVAFRHCHPLYPAEFM